jgi:hypothetical protein
MFSARHRRRPDRACVARKRCGQIVQVPNAHAIEIWIPVVSVDQNGVHTGRRASGDVPFQVIANESALVTLNPEPATSMLEYQL